MSNLIKIAIAFLCLASMQASAVTLEQARARGISDKLWDKANFFCFNAKTYHSCMSIFLGLSALDDRSLPSIPSMVEKSDRSKAIQLLVEEFNEPGVTENRKSAIRSTIKTLEAEPPQQQQQTVDLGTNTAS